MTDDFEEYADGLTSTARNAAAITPHNSDNLAKVTRGIYVGVGGDVSIEMKGIGTAIVFKGAAAGTVIPVRATRVNATNTTATDLVALW